MTKIRLLRSPASPRWNFLLLVLLAALAGEGVSTTAQDSAGVAPAAVEQNNIGVAYMNQYLFAEAAESFRNSLSASPGFTLARVNLGIALFYKQDYDESLLVLGDALARSEDDPSTHYTLGLLHKNRGENDKAIGHFSRVIELDPTDASAYYHAGVLKVRTRQMDEAEAALRRCLEIEPLNTSAMYNLGTLLLKLGRAEQGNDLLERFRTLQQQGESGGGMGIGNLYGEMGKYALARDFQPLTRSAEVRARPAGFRAPFRDEPALPGSPDSAVGQTFPAMGGGVALADLDGDGDIDAVVTRYLVLAERWEQLVLLNDGKGAFTDATTASGVQSGGAHVSCAIGDYDNDGMPDLYLVGSGGNVLYRNAGGGRFEDVTASTGVRDERRAVSATFVDYDHDGDLDIYLCRYTGDPRGPAGGSGVPNRMYRNNGDGTFTDHTDVLGVGGGPHKSLGMIATDLDNDRDIDLVVINEDTPPMVFSNQRNDRFSEVGPKSLSGLSDPYRLLNIADLDRDGSMDLLLSGGVDGHNSLMLNNGAGVLRPDSRSPEMLRSSSRSRTSTGFFDYDNDGDLDLFLMGPGEGELWENSGDGRFVFAGVIPSATGVRAAAAADLDGDGLVDIFSLDSNGLPRVIRNGTSGGRSWIGIRLEGLRSNRMGLGAKVEVRAGTLYQKLEIQGHKGGLAQDSAVVWLGLDRATKADSITVRWPSGVQQSEIHAEAGRIVTIKELDRKGTSCPLLYTWNGREFEFVTDFLGGSAYGYLVAPGQYNTPDADEYVLIEGRQLEQKDGRYLLRLNNQLEETILFDQAQLLVVDHPAGTEIYPNERLMPAPPFPEFRINTTREPRLPLRAVDDKGNDVLSLISKKDRVYPGAFRSLPFKGYAETHTITLDLGDLSGAEKVLLLLDAWIDYADSTSNLAASQAGIALHPPYLQVRDRAGEWVTVMPSMGFPAGLPKTMTVDLTGKFLSADYRIRIVTNMKIYWDRIRVDTSAESPVLVHRLDPVEAELRFLGYPSYYSPDGRLPWIYDYNRVRKTESWGTHAGEYTRYGDVRELLARRDDMFVITRHGDEIAVAFEASEAPILRPGWVRDFLLYAVGFGKDMDLNSLHPEVLGPLPFHSMSQYPYPSSERFPDGEEHREYRRQYNTRVFPSPAGRALRTGR